MSFYNHQNGKKQKFDNGNCRVSLVVQLIKNLPVMQETRVQSLVGKTPWRREWLPTPVVWPGEFHGLYTPRVRKESDVTERLSLSLHFSSAGKDEYQQNLLNTASI